MFCCALFLAVASYNWRYLQLLILEQPKVSKKKLDHSKALKDYPCKLDKKTGHLYVTENDGFWHQHKLLGLVNKVRECAM